MSEFTWTTNDFELSEYLTSNDNRMLPTAFTEGEIIREINSLEKKYAALKMDLECATSAADNYLGLLGRSETETAALKRENDGLRQEIIKVTVFYSKQMHPRIKGALLEIAAMEFDALLTIEEQEDDE